MARRRRLHSVPTVLDEVFAAAYAACPDQQIAADVTRRVLVARTDAVAAARPAAPYHPVYAGMAAPDRDAVVLARVFGFKTDRIARELETTPADVKTRLARGLRTLLPPRDCAGAASPG